MTIPEIFAEAERLGITLIADAGTIKAKPKGATPVELAEAIREHKREVLEEFIFVAFV
ncbi:MAG: hypothetical protein JO033_19615 [Acidobacteriaceae bacterium]|nr:hypothetical protein [Acidobacteriaceae bacterium]MBV9499157.1 hypothetical protein [Acidobacteriaceae bacterium]